MINTKKRPQRKLEQQQLGKVRDYIREHFTCPVIP